MTAEVCVMNKLGVALATDSAVTLGRAEAPKIYQSADKLFLMSTADPVAAMVYGDVSFLGVPWETIIKRYRRLCGNRSHPTVEKHAEAFFEFLENDPILFPEARQVAWLRINVRGVFWEVHTRFKERLENEFNEQDSLDDRELARILKSVARSFLEEVREAEESAGLPPDYAKIIRATYEDDIESEINQVFEKFPLGEETRSGFHELAGECFARAVGPTNTGLVVAGFGADEVFPALIEVFPQTLAAGKLRHKKGRHVKCSDEFESFVVAFAQQEMVQAFMGGIDPGLRDFALSSLQDVFAALPDVCVKAIPELRNQNADSFKQGLGKYMQDMRQMLLDRWESYQRKYLSGPVMDVVSVLPKDELASMAESLVSLTVLRRRSTTEAETVGGPIDVAVITKGDGFVWIKRKHYFDAHLNPRYLARLNPEERYAERAQEGF